MNAIKELWGCEHCNFKIEVEPTDLLECRKDEPRDARRGICGLRRLSEVEKTPVEQTLAQRGSTHGDFAENAVVAGAIRSTMRNAGNWKMLPAAQQLALDEIALKIARIVSSGAPVDFKEPWLDIQGYGKLGEKACH